MKLGIPIIVRNEQELLSWCLEGLTTIRDFIEVVSIVDNGSIDATPYIIEKYKARLPIVVTFEPSHHHHGNLRNLALEQCRGHGDWILYVDSDETFTSNMSWWLAGGQIEKSDIWDFIKYPTHRDHLHDVREGAGPTTRLFRNVPGVHYTELIHTHPHGDGLNIKKCCDPVYFFDHTALKSLRGLWAKGWRYQEHVGEVGVGSPANYVSQMQYALAHPEVVSELPPVVKNAGIIEPPLLDAHLYAILSKSVEAACWLKGG